MRSKLTLARRISIATFLALVVLINSVRDDALGVVLWGTLFTVGILHSAFVDGPWRSKPFYSPDFFVPAASRYGTLLVLTNLFTDWQKWVVAVIGVMLIASIDAWIMPLFRRVIWRTESHTKPV